MNEDVRKSATQRVTEMSNNNANRNFQKYDNFRAKVDAIVTLEDVDNMNQLVEGAEALNRAINNSLKDLTDNAKEYKVMADLYKLIAEKAKDLSDSNNDAAKNAKIINEIYKALEKNSGNLDKKSTAAAKNFLDTNAEILNTANEFKEIMGKSSETFAKNLSNNLKNITDDIVKLSNAFNLQKLVTGGTSLKDLQAMQGNVKISMNLDDTGFMGIQRELIAQNKEILNTTGEAYLTFSDTASYLSNIQDYSLKNYNQSTSLYKQITIGNRYLNLSNQSLSSMVKATNQMADDSYMNKQMAILSALGTDSGLSENISGIADFMSTNIAGVNARYNNGDEMIKESAAMYSVNEAYLGNNAGLANSLMAEIMNTNNYANLSEKTQRILDVSGMSHELRAQMDNDNVDMDKIMMGIYSGMYKFSQEDGGMNTLEMYELGEWATLADSYNRNRTEYENKVSNQLDLLHDVNVSEAQDMQEIEKLLGQNVNKSNFEKFSDKIFTMFGIQNQNWTQLNGYVQLIQTAITGLVLFNSVFQSAQQLGIHKAVQFIALKSGFSGKGFFGKAGAWLSSSSGMSPLLGGAALSKGAVLGAGASIVGGVAMGVMDGIKTKDWNGGWARGAFLGTGHSEASSGENTASVLGNAAKYALIGAGIGTFIGGPVGTAIGAAAGGLLGGALGLFGAHMDANTEAVKENTKTYGESRDSIATNSHIATLFKAMKNKEGAGAIAYGASSGSTSNFGMGAGGYPWSVTSQFGPRTLSNGDSSYHNGIDFGIKTGTPIGSPVSGTVTSVSRDNRNTYPGGPKSAGSGVYIQGDNGILYQFWHLSSVGVNKGDKVGYKQTIGLSGNTGYSTGPHLHFGTKKGGSWVNPGAYINGGLFSPDGKVYTANIDSNTVPVNDSSAMVTLKKDDVFQYNQGGKGGVEIPEESNNQGLATSADIDRLIKVITELNNNQNDQKDFLRALAGKNTFVYGREG